MSRFIACVLVIAFLSVPVGAAVGDDWHQTEGNSATETGGPHIESVYPNPLAEDDAGEYVLLDFPRPTNLTGWAISDGETMVSLPNITVEERVAVTADANVTRNATDAPLLVLNESLSLANGGDKVTLLDGERVVGETSYTDAPDAELWTRTTEGWAWEHLGATHFSAITVEASTARVFVLPDAPNIPVQVLKSANNRILLAGYTFSSTRVADVLKRAEERGVKVRVLVDDAPVGGMSLRQAHVLDGFVAAGVSVEVIGGDWARYDYHHAKYAIVDNRALVMTENWKPSGTGGHSNRGWGVVVRGETADVLANVFHADASWRDTVSWSVFRANETFKPDEIATESYPANFEPRRVPVESVQLLVTPDNAEAALVNDSIGRTNPSISSRCQSVVASSPSCKRRFVRPSAVSRCVSC